jgi:acyl-homoserine lactone acylase PvdQ
MRIRHLLPAALLVAAPGVAAQTAQSLSLQAPDGSTVSIERGDFGEPRVQAATEDAVFFGQGFAAAQDRLFQMETFWRVGLGRLAEIQGPGAVGQDTQIRTVFYTDEERAAQLAASSPRLRTMVTSYAAGVNAYIDSTEANPATYLPVEYAVGGFAPERWDANKVVGTVQFFIRRFGEIGGEELARLAELEANGPDWFDENRPINDPEAVVTIPSTEPVAPTPSGAYSGPAIDPAVAERVMAQRAALTESLIAHGVPHKFGSFAALVGPSMSETGNVMLLGAPQMGAPSQNAKAVTSEVELVVDGGLHVAGMTVPGIPGVIIGRTDGRTWTFTTGYTDNTDTYVESLALPGPGGVPRYIYDGETLDAEVFVETIGVAGSDDVSYTHFRTVHGPVIAEDFANGQAFTYKYAFWERELEMAEALFDVWDARSVEDFEAAAERVPVSFNFFYADKEQNIALWHVGDYPVRPAGTDPRLPLMGDGSEEWEGFLDFEEHPQVINPEQGFLANWNNKPAAYWDQGDNVSWTDTPPGGYTRTFDGVARLQNHLADSAPISFEEVQQLTRVVRQHPQYPEYPGTYQQVIEFSEFGSYAENVIPPGQSGFVNAAGVPSANFADQWAFYQSSTESGPILMKPFTFLNATGVPSEPTAPGAPDAGIASRFPNPVAERLTVRFQADSDARLDVLDLLGRRVATLHDGPVAGTATARLDASSLAPGLYVLRLVTADRVDTERFVVAR